MIRCNNCHDTKKPNFLTSDAKELDEFHQHMSFQHNSLKCVSCHNPGDYETLRMADSSTVSFDNVMQLSGKSFGNMGASIVDLGNNFAATEDEILTFATRIAPIGATVGLATHEVLGIATAFTSVGVPAERGGTAIQKTFIKMAEAVKDGGVELDIFADTAGMTGEAFADMFESDPASAFTAFVEGLGRVRDEGGNVFGGQCDFACPADLDGDGDIGFNDLVRVLAAWGNEGGAEDLDGDGIVRFEDVVLLLAAWGPCP